MSNETIKEVDVNTDDLEQFDDLLSGRAVAKIVTEETEKTEEESVDDESEDDSLANEQELDAEDDENEDDSEAESDDDDDQSDDDEDDEKEEAPKPKKQTVQERINEITAARREAEREADMLKGRLAELEKRISEREKAPEDKTEGVKLDEGQSSNEPTPSDLNEDGSEKYPLGEFDPKFVKDLTKFQYEELKTQDRLEREREQAKTELEQAELALRTEWTGRVEEAVTRYPDFEESVTNLEDTFKDADPALSQYLANTIMQSEHGTEILYYLSQNVDEAKEIVGSGATKATLALGRLEATLANKNKPSETPARKVTKAGAPPVKRSRGANGNYGISDDTDDLEAFEQKFFKKK